ncbi:hypothetical protein HO173_004669 [Letharia columbiana]|uniref:Uncharacterized protein n=1 Tax=Letharia columbiana TaxID=112416 RepID=A0A8H6FYS4_9LECA|nr:uncharacterized protein HO173_004669 [Letharia columbiana]KAF6237201.1 hypothetical protein HO173_004669 [Letharia columbiana]
MLWPRSVLVEEETPETGFILLEADVVEPGSGVEELFVLGAIALLKLGSALIDDLLMPTLILGVEGEKVPETDVMFTPGPAFARVLDNNKVLGVSPVVEAVLELRPVLELDELNPFFVLAKEPEELDIKFMLEALLDARLALELDGPDPVLVLAIVLEGDRVVDIGYAPEVLLNATVALEADVLDPMFRLEGATDELIHQGSSRLQRLAEALLDVDLTLDPRSETEELEFEEPVPEEALDAGTELEEVMESAVELDPRFTLEVELLTLDPRSETEELEFEEPVLEEALDAGTELEEVMESAVELDPRFTLEVELLELVAALDPGDAALDPGPVLEELLGVALEGALELVLGEVTEEVPEEVFDSGSALEVVLGVVLGAALKKRPLTVWVVDPGLVQDDELDKAVGKLDDEVEEKLEKAVIPRSMWEDVPDIDNEEVINGELPTEERLLLDTKDE